MKLQIKHLYLAIWLIVITYASLAKGNSIPKVYHIPHIDKLAHFIMYFVLTFLLIPNLIKRENSIYEYLIVGCISFIIGISFEILQHYLTTQRQASLYDVFANSIGILICILFYAKFIRNKKVEKKLFKI